MQEKEKPMPSELELQVNKLLWNMLGVELDEDFKKEVEESEKRFAEKSQNTKAK